MAALVGLVQNTASTDFRLGQSAVGLPSANRQEGTCGFRSGGSGKDSAHPLAASADYKTDYRKRRRGKMEGPWLGLGVMVAMVVGLVIWCVWAFRKDKKGRG